MLGHEELLEQIVFSLVENALRHAGATTIELVARNDETGFVELEIRDDGRGIPLAETRPCVRPLLPRERAGKRIRPRLAIVRESVRALGGTVRIDPRTGHGTTVEIQLVAGARVPGA